MAISATFSMQFYCTPWDQCAIMTFIRHLAFCLQPSFFQTIKHFCSYYLELSAVLLNLLNFLGIDVRSACVNPVSDAFWEWQSKTYHVRGVVNGTYELVRERNGPFAGKKINRPVAKYEYCHRVCSAYVK